MSNKIKVVWICSFSNAEVRAYYKTKINPILRKLLKFRGHSTGEGVDSARWNTNAIHEFEKTGDVELHIITPIRYLAKKEVRFRLNGINYYFFREENSGLIAQLKYQFLTKNSSLFHKNRKIIKSIIREVKPDIVHVIGAENPYYSLAALDIPKEIPTIVQLQALLHRAADTTKNLIEEKSFRYKGALEEEILKRADYIGTEAHAFRNHILNNIDSHAQFLDISIMMANKVDFETGPKMYDFVYFAAGINKAGEVAIESFGLAFQQNPALTLLVVGGYDMDFKNELDQIIEKYSIGKAVTFTGRLPTYDDVIAAIRTARFAILPIKIDLVPGVIWESICNGLPVITSITDNGTTNLNIKRESVMLVEQGDFHTMANNMVRLTEDPEYAEKLRQNALVTYYEWFDDYGMMQKWVNAYKLIASKN